MKDEGNIHFRCPIYEQAGNCYNDPRCIFCKKSRHYSKMGGFDWMCSSFDLNVDQKIIFDVYKKMIKTDLKLYMKYVGEL